MGRKTTYRKNRWRPTGKEFGYISTNPLESKSIVSGMWKWKPGQTCNISYTPCRSVDRRIRQSVFWSNLLNSADWRGSNRGHCRYRSKSSSGDFGIALSFWGRLKLKASEEEFRGQAITIYPTGQVNRVMKCTLVSQEPGLPLSF